MKENRDAPTVGAGIFTLGGQRKISPARGAGTLLKGVKVEINKRICDLCGEEVERWTTVDVEPQGRFSKGNKFDVCYKENCLNNLLFKIKEMGKEEK